MIRIIVATLTAGAVAVGLCAQIGPAAAQDYPPRQETDEIRPGRRKRQ